MLYLLIVFNQSCSMVHVEESDVIILEEQSLKEQAKTNQHGDQMEIIDLYC